MTRPSDTLDKLTRTFAADRQLFDDLIAHPEGGSYLEMCVWYLWLQQYLHDIQNSLSEGGAEHGREYQVWVVAMIGGAATSIGMLMYLLSRGVINESAAAARRALEYLGMASHLVRNPAKARFLVGAETESRDFENAFTRGQNQSAVERQRLKEEGIRFRFSGMSPGWAKAATHLYAIFSKFSVHGGTMSSLVSVEVKPTPNSCGFHNRSVSRVVENLQLFRPVIEIVAGELMDLVGKHGIRSQRINEAGACVLVWLNHQDPRWVERVRAMRQDFGLR